MTAECPTHGRGVFVRDDDACWWACPRFTHCGAVVRDEDIGLVTVVDSLRPADEAS